MLFINATMSKNQLYKHKNQINKVSTIFKKDGIELFPNVFARHFTNVYNLNFFTSGFSFTDTDNSQDSRRREETILFHSTTSTRSRAFRNLFATLHVRWVSHIFNHNACIYQSATQWDLPPYRITIWLIDDETFIFVCLHVELILDFVTAIWHEKPVDSNSHRLSSSYYKRTD